MPVALAFFIALATEGPQDLSGIIALDRALGEAVARRGLASAVGAAMSDSGVIVYPGAPVVVGKTRVRALLTAQRALDSMVIHWAPIGGWLSGDGSFGVTYGWTQLTRGPESRMSTYLACWRMERGAWRLIGLQLTQVVPPALTTVPAAVGPVELPPVAPTGSAHAMIQADLDFAAMAEAVGAPDAFAHFAAPEAILIGGAGTRRGPAEIRASLALGPPSDWSWFPVVAHSSANGDLGFTVGQAVIRPRDGGPPAYSKYLSVWRRTPGGQMRFLTDAGNPRPKG